MAIILAVITALETSTYWWVEDAHTVAMITLFVCMAIKFVMILLWFMHLKWDSALFSLMFLHRGVARHRGVRRGVDDLPLRLIEAGRRGQ